MTVLPGRVPAELTADPHPVETAHPVSAALKSGISLGIFTTDSMDTTVCPVKVEIPFA
jgi:hypothetical protein